MADNFNFIKFIKNNPLLKESIGGYRDIEPLKERQFTGDDPNKDINLKLKIIGGIDPKSAFNPGLVNVKIQKLGSGDLKFETNIPEIDPSAPNMGFFTYKTEDLENLLKGNNKALKLGKFTVSFEGEDERILHWLFPGMRKDEGTGLMTYWGRKPSGDPAIFVRKNGKLLSPDDQEALPDREFDILSQLKQKTRFTFESQNEVKDADGVNEGADFTRFYKVGAKYDNSDNPIGGFKEYTIVSVDPENQTVTVKGANGVKTFDAWEFGNDFMPARSKEAQWQDKYGPGADRFN